MILENIALVDIFKIIAVIALVVAFIIPKKKGYEYTKLDRTGAILNIVLLVLYFVMSVIGITTVFFSDSTATMSESKYNLMITVISIGVSIPLLAIASLFASVVLRKRGKSKLSFCVQFFPLLFFIIMMILAFVMLNMR